MLTAREDASDVPLMLWRKLPSDSEIEKLCVADDGVEGCSQLVAHHGQEVALGAVRGFGFGSSGALALDLAGVLLRAAAIRDVADGEEAGQLAAPLHFHDPKLGGQCLPVRAYELDLGRCIVGDGESELRSHKRVGAPRKELLGRRIGEADRSVGTDDHDSVSKLLDYRSEPTLLATIRRSPIRPRPSFEHSPCTRLAGEAKLRAAMAPPPPGMSRSVPRCEGSRHTLSSRTHTPRPEVPLSQYLLKLYVTGKSPKADAAIANLQRICDEELGENYELQIIDVLEHPQLAEDDKVLATPTLIKRLPPPLRRVIGDLSDRHKVLLGLEVRPDARRSAGAKRPAG